MITFRPALLLIVVALALSGCIQGQNDVKPSAAAPMPNDIVGAGTFSDRTAQSTGTVEVRQSKNGLILTARLQGLPPGPKGFHLHQKGLCDTPDFTSAGGHLNPLAKSHGLMSAGGAHLGDLPNLEVTQDGTATITTPIGGNVADAQAWVFDTDGTAVMIHEGPDDYVSDPTGGSGARIACAVIVKQ